MKKPKHILAIAGLSLGLGLGLSLALCSLDSPARAAETPSSPAPIPTQNLPAQILGPEDLIALTVYDTPELNRTFRISVDGNLRLPMVKERIHAAGLLPSELEEVIARELAHENILIDPVVSVTVAEYGSRPVSVSGAVKQPVSFQAAGKVTLLDALAKAGGLTPDAGSEILVSRMTKISTGERTSMVRRIPVKGLIDAADPELNLTLTGGEEIRVPDAGKIFVAGNVKKPGAFSVSGTDGCSVMKALAFAEGLEPFSSDIAYIYRRGDNGDKAEIPIDLKKIVARKKPDVTLLASDILYVPDNTGKRNTIGALDRLLGFSTTTASGLLIWKH